MNFIIRWIVTAVAAGVAVWIVPGISTVGADSTIAIAALALVLSLVNVSLKPILKVLSMPITVITLGIFYLVLNALLLELAAWASTTVFCLAFTATWSMRRCICPIIRWDISCNISWRNIWRNAHRRKILRTSICGSIVWAV